MKNFVNRVEKGLIRLVVFSLLLMVLVQGLMTADPIRFYLSWGERMEGQNFSYPVNSPLEEPAPVLNEIKSPQARLSISINQFSSLPKAKILINGKEKYNFTEKKIAIEINAGDTIEIDSSAYNFLIDYKIEDISSNLIYPSKGQIFTANQTIVMLGKVIVK